MSSRAALPDYAEALHRALGAVQWTMPTERIGLSEAAGRVLAQPIAADRDLPPFDRAMMDGYAVRAADVQPGRALDVTGEVFAGQATTAAVSAGRCVKIATGAPLPEGADAVIQHERTDRGNPVRCEADALPPGHAVHRRGSDARAGDVLITRGAMLGPPHLGVAASVGAVELEVVQRPRAVVLTSGDEVKPPDERVQPHEIRNANGPMLTELVQRFGAAVGAVRHVPDHPDASESAVRRALDEADLVVTVGGVSAGERDHLPAAFASCGVELALRGAAIQPGKPVIVGAAAGGAGGRGTVVVGLPGNPVSVLACACLFVWPIARALLGLEPDLPWRSVPLAEAVKPNPHRRAFRPAVLVRSGAGSPDESIRIPRWAGSGDLAHTVGTHGLAALPAQAEPVPAGTLLPFLEWPR